MRPPERRSFLNCSNHLSEELYRSVGVEASPAYELEPKDDFELMRTKYCIRYELGICPKIKKGEKASPLILVNNGREMLAEFFCSECEMSIRSNKGC